MDLPAEADGSRIGTSMASTFQMVTRNDVMGPSAPVRRTLPAPPPEVVRAHATLAQRGDVLQGEWQSARDTHYSFATHNAARTAFEFYQANVEPPKNRTAVQGIDTFA